MRLEVTDAGRKEVGPYLSELERLESEVRKHLTAQEAKTLRNLLEKLQTGLQEIEASSEGGGEVGAARTAPTRSRGTTPEAAPRDPSCGARRWR